MRRTGIILLICSLFLMPLMAEGQVEFVEFSDANLESAIRNALEIPVDPITLEEMATLRELDAYGKYISTLDGIEYGVNLTFLDLGWNNISDVTPLAELINLEQLYLDHNTITSVEPLRELTNLKKLKLAQNFISSVEPLQNLENLEELLVGNNYMVIDYTGESKDTIAYQNGLILEYYLAMDISMTNYNGQGYEVGNVVYGNPMLADPRLPDQLGVLVAAEPETPSAGANTGSSADDIYASQLDNDPTQVAVEPVGEESSEVAALPEVTEPVAPEPEAQPPVEVVPEPAVPEPTVPEVMEPETPAEVVEPVEEAASEVADSKVPQVESPVEVVPEPAVPEVVEPETPAEVVEPEPTVPDSFNKPQVEDIVAGSPDPSIPMGSLEPPSFTGPQIEDVYTSEAVMSPSLRAAVVDALSIHPEATITRAMLMDVRALNIEDSEVTSLEGIENFENLVTLEAKGNSIENLVPLAGLEDLRFIDLSDNEIVDIAPLTQVEKIAFLDLRDNSIRDFSPEKQWSAPPVTLLKDGNPGVFNSGALVVFEDRELEDLIMNQLFRGQDYRVLTQSDMLQITELYIYGESVDSLVGLEYAKNLVVLDAGSTDIRNIEPLRNLSQLKTLKIDDTMVSSIEPLGEIVSLQTLNVSGLPNGVVEGAKLPRGIRSLTADANDIGSVEFVRELSLLELLSLKDNKITSVEPIGQHRLLKELYLDNNNLGSLDFSQSLTGLVKISVNNNQLTDISTLNQSRRLVNMSVSNNQISGDYSIAPLSALASVDLSFNTIESIHILGNSALEVLNLSGNNLTEIEAEDLPQSLKQLYLGTNSLEEVPPVEDLSNLMLLDIVQNDMVIDFSDETQRNGSIIRSLLEQEGMELYFLEGNQIIGSFPGMVVSFQDEELESQVAQALGLEEGTPVTVEDIANLETLTWTYGYVENLWGLEYATSLVGLDLYYNEVINIDALENHPTLEVINLGLNDIVDISVLSTIPNLRVVNIAENLMIIDFTYEDPESNEYKNAITIKALLTKGVALLDEEGNDFTYENIIIGDVPFIPAMGDSFLDEYRNTPTQGEQVEEGIPAEEVEELEELVEEEPIGCIELIDAIMVEEGFAPGSYEEVTSLDLYGRDLTTLQDIEVLVNLSYLDIGMNRIEDLSPLAELSALTTVYADNNSITAVDLLTSVPLEHLFVEGNQIMDITPLGEIPTLVTLEIGDNGMGIDFSEGEDTQAVANGETVRLLLDRGVSFGTAGGGYRQGNNVIGTP